jgi:serine acetyltransferase
MPGVTIGEGAIVGAGSIVTKSVEPYTVVGGNPAHFLCTVEEFKDKNQKYDLGCKGMDYNAKKEYLLSLPDSSFIKK